MSRFAVAAAVAVFTAAAALGADPSDFGVPAAPRLDRNDEPSGSGAVGLVLAVLDVVLVLLLWRMVRRRGLTAASKTLLLGAIVVLPAIVVFLATANGMQRVHDGRCVR